MSSVFWLNLVRRYSLHKILCPKRRIESYSIMGTIVSPNKILLIYPANCHDPKLIGAWYGTVEPIVGG